MKIFFHKFHRAKFQRELRIIRREVAINAEKREQEEEQQRILAVAALLARTKATV